MQKFIPQNFVEIKYLPKFSSNIFKTKKLTIMSKGTDAKKEKKKEPTKSLKEKRADKKAKKAGKGGE
jgi:hypothetical protein